MKTKNIKNVQPTTDSDDEDGFIEIPTDFSSYNLKQLIDYANILNRLLHGVQSAMISNQTALKSEIVKLKTEALEFKATASAAKSESDFESHKIQGLKTLNKKMKDVVKVVQEEKTDLVKKLEATEKELDAAEELSNRAKCTVCCTNVRNIAHPGCGHVSMCTDCLRRNYRRGDRKCPICRLHAGDEPWIPVKLA